MKIIMKIAVAGLMLAGSGCSANAHDGSVKSFEECAAAGYTVTRSLPPKCITPDGGVFVGPRLREREQVELEQKVRGEKPLCEDLCGDGVCQEIVCLAEGCPCSENAQNCSQDCR